MRAYRYQIAKINPSTKLPSTKLPSTKLPSTKLPSTKLPSTKLPSTKLRVDAEQGRSIKNKKTVEKE